MPHREKDHKEQKPIVRVKETRESYPAQSDSHVFHIIQTLLAINSFDELQAIAARHPFLLQDEGDRAIKQCADLAFEQREYVVADCLTQVRRYLRQMKSGNLLQIQEARDVAEIDIPDDAYQALIESQTSDALMSVLQHHPVFYEDWFDAALERKITEVLDDGYERLAYILEHRHEQVMMLRQK